VQGKNLTVFYCKNETRIEHKKNVPITSVKQTKENRKLYPYLYLLGTWMQSQSNEPKRALNHKEK
jgi:hypothetical protein